MRRIRCTFDALVRRPVLLTAIAAFTFAAGFSATAGAGWYETCNTRCQQRYQACVANGNDEAVCYERLLQCQGVCNA